jgi:hypothetical protein
LTLGLIYISSGSRDKIYYFVEHGIIRIVARKELFVFKYKIGPVVCCVTCMNPERIEFISLKSGRKRLIQHNRQSIRRLIGNQRRKKRLIVKVIQE